MAKKPKPPAQVIVDQAERSMIIDSAKTPKGGWSKAQLALWGVPWPARSGWRQALINGLGPLPIYTKPDVTISHPASESIPAKLPRTAAATEARRLQTGYAPRVDKIVERISWLGGTDEDMRKALGVSEKTFYRWLKANLTMRQSRDAGREEPTAKVVKALYKRAVGYTHKAVHFSVSDGTVIQTPYRKHYPPDTGAATMWLTNRQPERWKNKQEHVVDLNVLARRALLEMADD